MPFDGNENTPALNRARLIEALRQPIPDWNFARFESCACGLAVHIGLITDHFAVQTLGRVIGISPHDAKDIFQGGEDGKFYGGGIRLWHVTPTMVADALERIQ